MNTPQSEPWCMECEQNPAEPDGLYCAACQAKKDADGPDDVDCSGSWL